MNATKLEKIISNKIPVHQYKISEWAFPKSWWGIDKFQVIEAIKSLPPTIGIEDINKLQRYYMEDNLWMYESEDGEYVRYDSLISLLTK